MHKIYRGFWSEQELDDLFNIIVSNNEWLISGTIGSGQIKDNNDTLRPVSYTHLTLPTKA